MIPSLNPSMEIYMLTYTTIREAYFLSQNPHEIYFYKICGRLYATDAESITNFIANVHHIEFNQI